MKSNMKNKVITRYIVGVLIGVLIICWVRSSGWALDNNELFSQFQFNFITPGARATALGGAFIGLADDATAVESNPAGLTILSKSEVSVEWKYILYTTEQYFGNLSWTNDITRRDFDNAVQSIPFTSLVYPYKPFVFSLYRQELVNYEISYRTGANLIVIPGISDPAAGTLHHFLPVDASVDLAVTNYGIGVAVELFEGFSIAVSPRWVEMNMNAQTTRYGLNLEYPEATNFSDDDIHSKHWIDDSDSGFSVNAGVLWRPLRKLSFGTVYRSGTSFTITEKGFNRGVLISGSEDITLNIPDSFGAGIAFGLTDFLTFTLDVVHIQYEDLLEGFEILIEPQYLSKNNYTVNNATEVHFGVEYILPHDKRSIVLRAGVYNEPDHTIRFTGTTGDPEQDVVEKEAFPGGEDQIHITGGVGLVVNKHFQVDAAANFADRMKQLSLSAVYKF